MQPQVKTNLGALKQGAHGHGEGFAAIGALVQAGTVGLALEFVVIANRAAVRADTAIGPNLGFKVDAGSVSVLEVGEVEDGGHMCFRGMA